MKILALLLCLAFVAPSATATVPPLPPDGVDWEYTTYEMQEVLVLKWNTAGFTGDTPLKEYRVYYQINGVHFPPESVPSDETEFMWGPLSDGVVYVFWITAVNLGGDESVPSTPLTFVGGVDYPYCTAVTWGISPPHVNYQPSCILPPPI